MVEILLGILGLGAITALLVRDYRRTEARKASEAEQLFSLLEPVMKDAVCKPSGIAGTRSIEGWLDGVFVQVRTVTDTLSLRKLPSLWLMITLPGDTGIRSRLDMMMRPAGQSSFSNFDFLRDTIDHPPGFPDEAVLKSDDAERCPSPECFRPLLRPFHLGYAKELLATPTGVRMVLQLAEGDRARYGVFRQAHFAAPPIRPEIIAPLVGMLHELRQRFRDDERPDEAGETCSREMVQHG